MEVEATPLLKFYIRFPACQSQDVDTKIKIISQSKDKLIQSLGSWFSSLQATALTHHIERRQQNEGVEIAICVEIGFSSIERLHQFRSFSTSPQFQQQFTEWTGSLFRNVPIRYSLSPNHSATTPSATTPSATTQSATTPSAATPSAAPEKPGSSTRSGIWQQFIGRLFQGSANPPTPAQGNVIGPADQGSLSQQTHFATSINSVAPYAPDSAKFSSPGVSISSESLPMPSPGQMANSSQSNLSSAASSSFSRPPDANRLKPVITEKEYRSMSDDRRQLYGDVCGLTMDEIRLRMERESAMDVMMTSTLPGLEMEDVDEVLKIVDEADIDALMRQMDSIELENLPRAAQQHEKWALKLFDSVTSDKGVVCDLSVCPIEEAATALRVLYAFVRRKDGGYFSPSTLVCLRAGLFRQLLRLRNWNIIADKSFAKANAMLRVTAGVFVKDGGRVRQFAAIEHADLEKLRRYFDRSTPTKLQEEVYYLIALHFGLRGREWIRSLQVDSFERIVIGDVRSFKLKPMESKTVHGSLEPRSAEELKQGILAETGGPSCPYAALELYMAKIAEAKRADGVDCKHLFIRPRARGLGESWFFGKQTVGHNTLANMMATISTHAGLSKRYTGHCIRATLVTDLHDKGVPIADIAKITGHKSVEAAQRYIRRTPKRDADMAKLSSVISGTGEADIAQTDDSKDGNNSSSIVNWNKNSIVKGGHIVEGQMVASGISGTFNNCTFHVILGGPEKK